MRKTLSVALSLILLPGAGCAGRIWPSDAGVRVGKWAEGDATGNWARTEVQRAYEWRYNHPLRQAGEPGVCVALSGGGLRSASFAIGVLSGLHERGALREVDRMSSVSGGGYASSWYLVHQYVAWRSAQEDGGVHDVARLDAEMFETGCDGRADGCAYQRQLEGGVDILANPFRGDLDVSSFQGLSALIATVPFMAANLILNGIFGWHANTSPLRVFYQARVERVFHKSPGSWLSLGAYGVKHDVVRFERLREMYEGTRTSADTHLPYPIVIAAANLNHSTGAAALHVANRLFEITPGWHGSDGFGLHGGELVDLHKAVAVSGAALDSEIALAGPPSLFASLLNMDLGYHVDNPIFTGHQAVYRIEPFPLYFFSGWQNDLSGARIHLTDGGHAENIGAFALFRRLCRQTVIVDGTHDPNLGFDDYRVLRDSLRGELGLELEVKAIDRWLQRQQAVARVLRTARRVRDGANDLEHLPRIVRDLKRLHGDWAAPIRASYDPDAIDLTNLAATLRALKEGVREHLKTLRKAAPGHPLPSYDELEADMAWLLLDPENAQDREWAQVLDAEVLEGELHGLKRPNPRRGPGEEDEVEATLGVLYLKLNLPREARLDPDACNGGEWGEDACAYHRQPRRRFRDLILGDSFPQEATADLSYEGEQYRAYRAVGRALARHLCLGPDEAGSWFAPSATWSYRPLSVCAAR